MVSWVGGKDTEPAGNSICAAPSSTRLCYPQTEKRMPPFARPPPPLPLTYALHVSSRDVGPLLVVLVEPV